MHPEEKKNLKWVIDNVAVSYTHLFDHMQYLGNTIEAIAGEKAGIIVPGVPVIYDGNNPAAAGVIRARAQELGSPYFEEMCIRDRP